MASSAEQTAKLQIDPNNTGSRGGGAIRSSRGGQLGRPATKTKKEAAPYHKRVSNRRRTISAEQMTTGMNEDSANDFLALSQPAPSVPAAPTATPPPTSTSSDNSGLAMILRKLDVMNENQTATNVSVNQIAANIAEVTGKVNLHSTQITNIQ